MPSGNTVWVSGTSGLAIFGQKKENQALWTQKVFLDAQKKSTTKPLDSIHVQGAAANSTYSEL